MLSSSTDLFHFLVNFNGNVASIFLPCRKLLTAVSSVTIEDLKKVGELYFSKMLELSLVTMAVCCNPSKVQEVKEGLEK